MEYITWSVDPVLFSLFGLKIHWYGLLFSLAILSGLRVMKWCFKQENLKQEKLDSLLTYIVVGIIIGARLGHCFFYEPHYYLSNPIKILAIWEGGLASHGGGLGAIIACYLYAKKQHFKLLFLLDRLAIATALFGFFVRIGNFINAEIVGLPTQVPWAVIFSSIDQLPRHAVQLYEAIAYLTVFITLISLYYMTQIKHYLGALLGVFLTSVFTARFILEFFKEKQAAYSSDLLLSTGQMLSLPFFVAGITLLIISSKKQIR